MHSACDWFAAILAYQSQFATFNNNITAYKTALSKGQSKDAALTALVVPTPTLPEQAAPTNIFGMLTALVAKIKRSLYYSVADGRDLGIEGATIAPPDPATLRPVLAVGLAAGGHPDLKWRKQGMAQVELCVDRGSGKGWEPLIISTQAHYVDIHELPGNGQSAVWTYRAIYRYKDIPAGQWSATVTTVVGG